MDQLMNNNQLFSIFSEEKNIFRCYFCFLEETLTNTRYDAQQLKKYQKLLPGKQTKVTNWVNAKYYWGK